MLMGAGQDAIKKYDLSQVRHVLSVGEQLNPEVIRWCMNAFGLSIHATWWMTETGGHVFFYYPCMVLCPGSMGQPMHGVRAAFVE